VTHLRYKSHRNVPAKKGGGGLSWLVKAAAIFLACLFGLFDHALGGWGEPIFLSILALFLPIFALRKFWGQRLFWIMTAVLGIIQVPLIEAVHPVLERAGGYSMVFAMADCLFVIAALSLVCSKLKREKLV
jgi:hypothetical protein